MDLSIIVPVYNVEKYIRPCIESIFKQGIGNNHFELIIVNDGTKDRSMELIADIIRQHDNIIIINQENQGLSMARNNGIAIAKGEYILMIDSDDLLIEDSLPPILEKALETKADLVVANFVRMTDKEIDYTNLPQNKEPFRYEEKNGTDLYLENFSHSTSNIWHTLFKSKFIRDNKITFIPSIYFEDIPFSTECYLKAGKCIYTSWILNIYRERTGSISDLDSFTIRQAKDYTTSIVKTWELRKLHNTSPQIQAKLKTNLYTTYTSLLYRILFKTEKMSDQIQMLKYFKQQNPDLVFTFSLQQKIGNLLYTISPRLYIIAQRWWWKS